MDMKKHDLLQLSDSQRSEFMKHVRVYLKQRLDEEKFYKSICASNLKNNNLVLDFDLAADDKNEMKRLKETNEKIRGLELEKRKLLLEIDELRNMAEAKASVLESEISVLRDEISSLKILVNGLGSS
jgi:hypothetical protein